MSRGIFTGFFVFIILFQSMDRFGMIAFYELNKAYITEMFCINKSRPEMGCEGKCFLMQRLQEKDQNEEKLPARMMDSKEIVLFPIHHQNKTNFDFNSNKVVPAYVETFRLHIFVSDIFHPPQVS